MQPEEENIEKRYYSIAEAAEMLGVNQSVLRFWEKEFGNISSRKTHSGRRQYTLADLERLKMIHYLLKVKKYTLKGAREAMKQQEVTIPATTPDVASSVPHSTLTGEKEMLQELKDFLVRVRQSL